MGHYGLVLGSDQLLADQHSSLRGSVPVHEWRAFGKLDRCHRPQCTPGAQDPPETRYRCGKVPLLQVSKLKWSRTCWKNRSSRPGPTGRAAGGKAHQCRADQRWPPPPGTARRGAARPEPARPSPAGGRVPACPYPSEAGELRAPSR